MRGGVVGSVARLIDQDMSRARAHEGHRASVGIHGRHAGVVAGITHRQAGTCRRRVRERALTPVFDHGLPKGEGDGLIGLVHDEFLRGLRRGMERTVARLVGQNVGRARTNNNHLAGVGIHRRHIRVVAGIGDRQARTRRRGVRKWRVRRQLAHAGSQREGDGLVGHYRCGRRRGLNGIRALARAIGRRHHIVVWRAVCQAGVVIGRSGGRADRGVTRAAGGGAFHVVARRARRGRPGQCDSLVGRCRRQARRRQWWQHVHREPANDGTHQVGRLRQSQLEAGGTRHGGGEQGIVVGGGGCAKGQRRRSCGVITECHSRGDIVGVTADTLVTKADLEKIPLGAVEPADGQ